MGKNKKVTLLFVTLMLVFVLSMSGCLGTRSIEETKDGTLKIRIERNQKNSPSRLIPDTAEGITIIVCNTQRKIVNNYALPESGAFETEISIPAGSYDVYTFSTKNGDGLDKWMLTSGKASVTIQSGIETNANITLSQFTYSITVPESIPSGADFTAQVIINGAGIKVLGEPFLISSYFVYSTSPWDPDEYTSMNKVFSNPQDNGEDSVIVNLSVTAPSVASPKTLYYRFILYQPNSQVCEYFDYFPCLSIPNSQLDPVNEPAGEIPITLGENGVLSLVIS